MGSDLSHWSISNLEIKTLCLHFQSYVVPKGTIRTIDHLWKTNNHYGFKFQPPIGVDLGRIKWKIENHQILNTSISTNFFVLPNTLFLKHLFQMEPFETALFYADLFFIDQICQTESTEQGLRIRVHRTVSQAPPNYFAWRPWGIGFSSRKSIKMS